MQTHNYERSFFQSDLHKIVLKKVTIELYAFYRVHWWLVFDQTEVVWRSSKGLNTVEAF